MKSKRRIVQAVGENTEISVSITKPSPPEPEIEHRILEHQHSSAIQQNSYETSWQNVYLIFLYHLAHKEDNSLLVLPISSVGEVVEICAVGVKVQNFMRIHVVSE